MWACLGVSYSCKALWCYREGRNFPRLQIINLLLEDILHQQLNTMSGNFIAKLQNR